MVSNNRLWSGLCYGMYGNTGHDYILSLLQKSPPSANTPQLGSSFYFMPQNPNCLALEDPSQKQLLESLQNDNDFGPKFTITWQGSLPEPASSKSYRCLWQVRICPDDIPEKLSIAEVRKAQCPVGYLVAFTNLKTFTRINHILKASFTLG